LIHIPPLLYTSLLQPILRVLLPQADSVGADPTTACAEGRRGTNEFQHHGFLNVSVTPLEASLVCPSHWAKTLFKPALDKLPPREAKTVDLSRDEYLVLSVISAGLDAARRVMELTSPLALAGIPIFFISTYYSDFILVPAKAKDNVIKAFEEKGLHLGRDQGQFVHDGSRTATLQRSTTLPSAESSAENDVQTRAFDTLKKSSVLPMVLDGLHLVHCSGKELDPITDEVYDTRHTAGRHTNGHSPRKKTWVDTVDPKLYACLTSALVADPKFISVTLAQGDPPSLLLDKSLLSLFADSIIGDTEDKQVPIFLDLVKLPVEIIGIVCGVAGRLVRDMQMAASAELSYLSTARAGVVILPEEQAGKALDILRSLLSKDG
jgi:ACT domain